MASNRLPLLPFVVVMVMVSLLALLLQSSAAAVEPHIEMVVNDSKSSSNDYCHYQLTVRTSGPVLGSGTDSTLTFYVWDNYGNYASVSQDGSVWGVFEQNHYDVLDFDGPCIIQPCVLQVFSDFTGSGAAWLMSYATLSVTGGPTDVTFYNGKPGSDGMQGAVWLGPDDSSMLQIAIC